MKRSDKARRQASAAEHEQRTGMVANMQGLGWRCRRRSKVDGTPLEFEIGDPMGEHWLCNRTTTHEWKVVHRNRTLSRRGYNFHNSKCISPTFPGPVAAAIWLRVEISNGVRFDS